MHRSVLLATGVALSLAAAAAARVLPAESVSAGGEPPSERPSADLLKAPAARVRPVPPVSALAAAPSEDRVGDAASFGRNATWLGVTNGFVTLTDGCMPEDSGEGSACVPLQAAPAATTFQALDLVRIQLPANASHSLLCHWFSPAVTVGYANPGAVPVVASLRYTPTLTVENEVLQDPSLIDAGTGLPFNGRLTASMTASERLEMPLPAGTSLVQTQRDTATCIAGVVSRRGLVNTHGLTEAQAKAFFKKPTTVRLNISGSAQHVDYARLVLGLRLMGD